MFYEIWDLLPPMLPDLSSLPVVAAIAGGLFVGIGTGLIVRQGGSGGGDDALALTHIQGDRMEACNCVSVNRYDGPASFIKLYFTGAHCLLSSHGMHFINSYRRSQEFQI